ncbi:MAG: glycoside hydrolase family 3 N-terminal domain-containing protein [bacterium]
MIIGIFLSLQTFAQYEEEKVREAERWADSVYQSLSLTERIGQLIFIRANYSGENYLQEVPDLIKKYNLGGVTFFAGNPLDQVLQTNIYNQLPRVPLFISIDAEWGLGMRLSNTVSYPLQMTLGAVRNENLIYEMGRQIAQQCRRMGIHINFAPVVDVNNNPENPVIGMRAFGDMPGDVARKGALYMKGLQDGNVLASAKHFPGHGDTRVDSHKDLPVLKKSKRDLRELEFKPFKYLIDEGVASVMVAHLSVPSFDRRKYRPASLSENLIGKQLKKRMGFGGLVISDGLDMKGVTKYFRPGEIALEAFTAGNDILLIPEDIPASVSAIQQAIASGKVEEERLEESCRKILKYKYLVGAHQRKTIDTAHLPADLNKRAYFRLREQLFDSAITLVKNDRNLVPLSYPDTIKPALVIIGEENPQPFAEAFRQFMPVAVHYLRHDADINARQQLFSEIEEANMLIVALVNTNISAARNYGITDGDIQFVEFLARQKPVILDVFASPYVLDFFSDAGIFHAILVSYQDKPGIQRKSAGIILGMDASSGKLPVSAGGFTTGTGWSTPKTRLSYAMSNPCSKGWIYLL